MVKTGENEVKESKQSGERLQALMDEAPVGICYVDLKGKITYVNKRFEEVSGYSREEVVGKNGFKLGLFSGETLKLLVKRMKERLLGRTPGLLEMQFKCKDGHWIWISLEGKIIRRRGIPVGFQLISRDITERKRAEEALQVEKNKLQSLIDAMEYGLTIHDRDYNIIYQNELFQRTSGSQVGEKCYRAYEGRDKVCDGCPVEKAFRDGKSHTSERKVVTPSGEVTFWEHTANPVRDAGGRIISCLEITRNITERKRAEEALRESEERYRAVIEGAHDMIQSVAPDGHIIFVNRAWLDTLGYTDAELPSLNLFQIIHPDSRAHCQAMFTRVISGEPVYGIQASFLTKDGRRVLVEGNAAPRIIEGKVVATQGIFHDITKRKQAEDALRQSREELRKMFESVTDGVIVVDLNGVITETNQSAVEMHGFSSRDELLGKSALELVAPRDRESAATNMRKALKQGTARGVEYTLLQADGTEFPGELGTSVLRDASGKWVGHITIVRDVSERKRAEDVLQAEKNKLQSLVDAMEHGLTILDRDYNLIYQSQPSKMTGGYHLGEKCYQAYEGRDKPCDGCPVEKAFRDGKSHTSERRIVTPSGEILFLENTANPIRDAGGRITSCLEIGRDVSERKQAEEALRESEERFRSIVENSQAGIMILDNAYRFVYANDELCQIAGYSREETIGQDFRQFLDEESQKLVADRYIRRQRGEEIPPRYEFNFVRKDGQKRRAEISSSVIRDSAGEARTLAQILDITERKRAEEELRLRAQILDGATDAIFVHDLDDNFIYVNEAACQTHGYSREEFLGMKLPQMVAPERARSLASDRQELLEKGQLVTESVHLRKDGSIMPVEIHARTIEMGGGRLFLTIARDITERKQAEEELRLRVQMLDGATDSIFVHDLDENFIYVNEAACRTHGYSREEFLGMKLRQIVVPEKIGSLPALRQETLGKGEATFETAHLRKDGSIIPLEVHSRTIESGGRKLILAVMRDITARKKAEEAEKRMQQELYLSRRLAAIGELAAGVAHEINNPLTGVLGFSQRLLRKSTSEALSRDLEIIHDEAQRAANIVQNLLTFARRRQPKKEYSDINDIVQKALELRSYALQTGNIEVATNLAPSLPKVMVDFPQIQEVCLNIILNAEQAMNEAHGGGKLIIKTQQIKDYVRISFTDDGPGIPPEQLDKVFDPFFTTREGKGGTGLGLSVCHGIVTGHGGKIYARSKPGRGGTTFFVELPLTPVETPVGRRV